MLLVLNKPHGLPVQGGPGHHPPPGRAARCAALRLADRPRLVHRLDRDTSGVLLLARTPGTAAKLAAAFRSRDVEKTYWAVVARRPVPSEGRIDLPLRRIGGARGERTEAAERDDKDAARAITDYRTLDHAGRNWLAGTAAADRAHAPASRPLRGDRRTDPGRCEICRGPTRTTPSPPRWRASRANFTCMRGRSVCPIPQAEHCWWRRTCRPT